MRQDILGGLGPHEWLTTVAPTIDKPADRSDQISHRWEPTVMDRLTSNNREKHLNQIHP
jgi:hypothetical protein